MPSLMSALGLVSETAKPAIRAQGSAAPAGADFALLLGRVPLVPPGEGAPAVLARDLFAGLAPGDAADAQEILGAALSDLLAGGEMPSLAGLAEAFGERLAAFDAETGSDLLAQVQDGFPDLESALAAQLALLVPGMAPVPAVQPVQGGTESEVREAGQPVVGDPRAQAAAVAPQGAAVRQLATLVPGAPDTRRDTEAAGVLSQLLSEAVDRGRAAPLVEAPRAHAGTGAAFFGAEPVVAGPSRGFDARLAPELAAQAMLAGAAKTEAGEAARDLAQLAAAQPLDAAPARQAPVQAPAAMPHPAAPPPEAQLQRHVARQIRNVDFTEGKTRIELAPHGIGELEIEISRSEAGKLQIALRAESVSVLHMIRNDRDTLIDALQSRGIPADAGDMDFQTFGERDRQGGRPQPGAAGGVAPVEGLADPLPSAATVHPVPGTGIDILT